MRYSSPSRCVPASSALLASGAPPTPFERPRGFPRWAVSWSRCATIDLRGVRCLSRVLGPCLHPFAPSPREPLQEGTLLFRSLRVCLSWGSCSQNASTSGAPFGTFPLAGFRDGRGMPQPRRMPPSGFLPLSTVLAGSRIPQDLLGSRLHRDPRRFAAFFRAARVPGASFQSFPFPRSRARSRGPLLPYGFALDSRRRNACETFTTLSPEAPALCPREPARKRTLGRMSRDQRIPVIARLVVSRHSKSAPHVPSLPTSIGLVG